MWTLILLRTIFVSRTALTLENIALRQQLAVLKRSVPRPQLRMTDRIFWVALSSLWSRWRESLHMVRPATVVAWHRQGWKLLWRLKSRGEPGRPAIAIETRELIRRLSRENPLWGAPRIQLELAHLGFDVAKSTVDKYMVRRSGPPSPKWGAFLKAHADELLACDFFTIPTASFKSLIGFVVIDLARRRIVACDVTSHPTSSWAAVQIQRAWLACGGRARYLLRDRDSIYGDEFKRIVRALGLKQVVTQYHSPLQNAHAERVIGTIRRERLDHMIILGEGQRSWKKAHAGRLEVSGGTAV